MNTLMIITLSVAVPVYALLWHNQDAHPQKKGSHVLRRHTQSQFGFEHGRGNGRIELVLLERSSVNGKGPL